MFLRKIRKNNLYPVNPYFFYIKLGLKWVKIIQAYFHGDVRHIDLYEYSNQKYILKAMIIESS